MLVGGSYSWRWSNSRTGEDVGSIGISTGPGHARLSYSHDDTPISETLRIAETACNYGGVRPWFMCPRCSRRVAVLFLRSGRFMCRPCGRVAYASQAEDAMGRAWRRQGKLEARLDENWRRPKGMHHATRERLVDGIFDCERLRDEALSAYLCRYGLMGDLGF